MLCTKIEQVHSPQEHLKVILGTAAAMDNAFWFMHFIYALINAFHFNASYQERCIDPVLVTGHFQYKVEVFVKEIILDGPLWKTKYYAIRIEFQKAVCPHVNSNAPNVENEAANIDFIEKTENGQLQENLNDPEIFELVKTDQVHLRFLTYWKYNKNEC